MIEAKYTTLFKVWLLKIHEGLTTNGAFLLSSFTNSKFTQDMASDLLAMLKSVYNYYEIGDDEEMSGFMIDTFNEYYEYYYDLITNYRKEYDYALNNKKVLSRVDDINMVGNTQIDNEYAGSNTQYELPNKVIDESYRSTPSSILDDKNKNTNNKDYTNNTTRTSTITTEFNNEFIDLKNKYINQIRNVYREFAMKFKECFYQIY